MVDTDNSFDLFCSISKYDIRKSTFYTDDYIELIKDCFNFVIEELKLTFADCGVDFDESIFQPTRKMSEWKPFKDALFCPWKQQADRRIVLSENEIYICNNNKWVFNTVITSGNGRQLIGYIMKQMEVALRKVTRYKFKLSANINTITHEAMYKLRKAGLSLETIINDGVDQFYKEATKTVVVVDKEALSRIRQEALITQEKLYVPEQEKPLFLLFQHKKSLCSGCSQTNKTVYSGCSRTRKPFAPDNLLQQKFIIQMPPYRKILCSVVPVQGTLDFSYTAIQDKPSAEPQETQMSTVSDVWDNLKNDLTQIETEALSVVLLGKKDLKKYADECGIMIEVLVDGINEKAMDNLGDNLIDEEFMLYDDYKEGKGIDKMVVSQYQAE